MQHFPSQSTNISSRIVEAFRRQGGYDSFSASSSRPTGRIEERALEIFSRLVRAFGIDHSDAYIPDSARGFFSKGCFHPSLPGIGASGESIRFSSQPPNHPAACLCSCFLDAIARDLDALAAVYENDEEYFSQLPAAASCFKIVESLDSAPKASFSFNDLFADEGASQMPDRLAAGALFCLSFALARAPWRIVEVFGFDFFDELALRGIKTAAEFPSPLSLDELARISHAGASKAQLNFEDDAPGFQKRMENLLHAAAPLDSLAEPCASSAAAALEEARRRAAAGRFKNDFLQLLISEGFILPAAVRTEAGDELAWIPDLSFNRAGQELSKAVCERDDKTMEDVFIEAASEAGELLKLDEDSKEVLLRAGRLVGLALQTKIEARADLDCRIHLSARFEGSDEDAYTRAFLELQAKLFAARMLGLPAARSFGRTGEAVLEPEDSARLLSNRSGLSTAGLYAFIDPGLAAARPAHASAALSLAAGRRRRDPGSLLSKNSLSDFDWKINAAGCDFTVEEFERQIKRLSECGSIRPRLATINKAFFIFDPSAAAELVDAIKRLARPSASEKICALASGESNLIEGARVRLDSELARLAEKFRNAPLIEPTRSFAGRLLEHQKLGFSRLVHGFKTGIGLLLADDMGLGKTVQTAAALAWLKDAGELERTPALVAAPAALLANWKRELSKFAPGLKTAVFHGQKRSLDEALRSDVVLTSYATAAKDAEKLREVEFRVLVVDEAHNLKNPSALHSKKIKSLRFTSAAALTGTPIENRLMDLWAVFSIIEPAVFGTRKEFAERFAEPIEARSDKAALGRLKKVLAPFMLRRLKSDEAISSMLPEKKIIDKTAPLLPEQALLYKKALAKANHPAGSIGVLELISQLKQICNSAGQIQGRFSDAPDSGKALLLLEILSECRACGFKALVFTQYVETLKRLSGWILSSIGIEPILLHGSMSLDEREARAELFKSAEAPLVMLASLKAAGIGLNLESADVVVHYDAWWNPAVENQASDRAFRIGRKSNVVVYRLTTEGTLEEKINKLVEKKKNLAESALAGADSWLEGLSDDEKAELFALGLQDDYSE